MEIKGYCRGCNSQNLEYYFGTLGYEAIVCDDCGTHHSNAEPILTEKGEAMKEYRIDCWMKVDVENPEPYEDLSNAQDDLDQQEMMFPENIYKIIEIDVETGNETEL